MSPVYPVGSGAGGVNAPPAPWDVQAAPAGQAPAASAAEGAATSAVSTSTSISVVSTQVDAMLASIGGGVENNQFLRVLLALLIMQALLGGDGLQKSSASAVMDLLGQAGGNRQASLLTLHSATNIIQIEHASTILTTSQAATTPTATEGDPDRTGGQIDLSA